MTRLLYGVTPGDVIAVVGDDPTATDAAHQDFGPITGSTVTIWSADRSTQETDLLAVNLTNLSAGSAITVVTADAKGRIPFFGKDGYTGAYWAKDSDGSWWLLNPADLASRAVLSPTIVNAKGDLLVGTADDTVGRFAAGANGQYVVYDSTTATGLKAVTPPTIPDVSGYATKAGTTRQFADVPDTIPADGDMEAWDASAGSWAYIDPADRFAQVDSATGQLVESSWPQGFLPIAVLNEGDPVPNWAQLQVIIPAGAPLDPTLAVHLSAPNANNCAGVIGTAFAVDDPIVLVCLASAEATSPVDFTFTFSTGAATLTKRSEAVSGTTAQVDIYSGRVTTAIPATATVTCKSVTAGTTTPVNRVHLQCAVVKPANLVAAPAAPFDQQATGTGSSTSILTANTAPTTSALAQVRELGIMGVAINSGASGASPLVTRSVVGASGWAILSQEITETSPTGSARALAVLYKVFNDNPTIPERGQSTIAASPSGTQSGQWAAAMATFRGA